MKNRAQALNKVYVISVLILGFLFFNFVGQQGYLEMRDTAGYKLPGIEQGIMPVYPLLLNLIRLVYGDDYLSAAVFVEGLIVRVCLVSTQKFDKIIGRL